MNWFEVLQKKLAQGERVLVDDLIHTGFLDVEICYQYLKAILLSDVINRLFHVSTKNLMTRYSFARAYARTFKKDENLIEKENGHFPADKASKNEQAGFYYQLDTSNLEEYLNINTPTIEESLLHTYRKMTELNVKNS